MSRQPRTDQGFLTSVKSAARQSLPSWLFPSLQRLWHSLARTPYVQLNRRYLEAYGDIIRAGPFVGTQYPGAAVGDNLIPKLLGTYELELHEHIERMLDRQPHRVVNVGCAEGYYAIGFARRLPQAEIIASDVSPSATQACTEMAQRVAGQLTLSHRSLLPSTLPTKIRRP